MSNQISEKVLKGESISNIANFFNLKTKFIENLTQDYNDYDEAKKIIFINLIPASFRSNKDFVSDIKTINENISYIFNVTKIIPASPIKYEKIKNDVLSDWKTSKKIEKIKSDTKKNINNNSFLSNLATQYNLKINKISISKNSNELPINLVNNIFNSEKKTGIHRSY